MRKLKSELWAVWAPTAHHFNHFHVLKINIQNELEVRNCFWVFCQFLEAKLRIEIWSNSNIENMRKGNYWKGILRILKFKYMLENLLRKEKELIQIIDTLLNQIKPLKAENHDP